MFISFEKLSSTARIWIYQSDRRFTSTETNELNLLLEGFISEWTAHGNNLHGSFNIMYDQFIIIGVDENFNQASGCSIDASVNFIKSIEGQFNLSLNDRSKVAFLMDDEIVLEDFRNMKVLVNNNAISSETQTFNNHITTKKEWEEKWITPLEGSWLKKYL